MHKPSFFKSRPVIFSALTGVVTFSTGAGLSTAAASKLESICTTAVDFLIKNVGRNITISQMGVILHLDSDNITITLDDISTDLPPSWLNIIGHTTDIPPYCFSIPLTLGLCFSFIVALVLANLVFIATYIREHNNAPHQSAEPLGENSLLTFL
ncbi:MAG: hypothetical protein Q8R79_08655 [Legionellaceae bacterium]|nr:hypothetical protein [Legionellaceae bacterium]